MTTKLRRLPAVLLSLLLLSACGGPGFDPQELTDKYAGGCFQAVYTASTHAGFFLEYRLESRREDGSTVTAILAPESVAGVKATLSPGESRMIYEDLSLDALTPEAAGFTPMDGFHCLLDDLASAPDAFSVEEDTVTVEYRAAAGGYEGTKRAVLRRDTLDLVSAELYLDGSLVLSMTMESFQEQGQPQPEAAPAPPEGEQPQS